MAASAESLASCSRDIVRFYTNAEEACQLYPGDLREQHAQWRVQDVVFGLCAECDALRDNGVESGLVYFACAYSCRSGELLEGKFPSYHHAVYSLACDVVANIRLRLELHPPDWTILVEDLNRRAIDFEDLAEACDKLRSRLDQELAIAINLQTPNLQQVTRVASAGAFAGQSATRLAETETAHAKDMTGASSTETKELARTKVTKVELPRRLMVNLQLSQVRYDGTCYDVSGDGALLVKWMLDSYPLPFSASEKLSKPSVVKKSLPPELRALIKSEPGKGYRLELPPTAPEIRQ